MAWLLIGGRSFFAFGQASKPIHFGTENGLPSNTVYYVMQDREGYLWFATDQGVARYDGYEFDVFTEEDGLSDKDVFAIVEDARGRLWFATNNGIPCFYDQGRFYNPENSPLLAEVNIGGYIQHIYPSPTGDVWLLGQISGLFCLSPEDTLKRYSFGDEWFPAGVGHYQGEDFLYGDAKFPATIYEDSVETPSRFETEFPFYEVGSIGYKPIFIPQLGLALTI